MTKHTLILVGRNRDQTSTNAWTNTHTCVSHHLWFESQLRTDLQVFWRPHPQFCVSKNKKHIKQWPNNHPLHYALLAHPSMSSLLRSFNSTSPPDFSLKGSGWEERDGIQYQHLNRAQQFVSQNSQPASPLQWIWFRTQAQLHCTAIWTRMGHNDIQQYGTEIRRPWVVSSTNLTPLGLLRMFWSSLASSSLRLAPYRS